jgi:peptidyl-prolyl cis-trans isomerase SDCCAG10
MASTYNLEPQPTAKVLLHTTSGDLELSLFAKQTPFASRNFLQHCLDGYYNGTTFHRLVPGFIIQGGDPTGTGHGGEAIYDGGLFDDEFHSRLKFNRRGLLGMANSGKKDDNGSQFFLTLAKAEELTGVNVMFGRVEGDTIYNLMKMAEADLDDSGEKPLYPTKVTGAEVLVNPFEDMVAREPRGPRSEGKKVEKKKGKKKGGKVLLSFGEDGEEDNIAPLPKKPKFNTKLVTSGSNDLNDGIPSFTKTVKKQPAPQRRTSHSPSPRPQQPPATLPTRSKRDSLSPSASISPPPPKVPSKNTLDDTNAQIAALKASMKRNVPVTAEKAHKKSALEQMIPERSIRGRKRKAGGMGELVGGVDKDALDFLSTWKRKLDSAPVVEDRDIDMYNEHAAGDENRGGDAVMQGSPPAAATDKGKGKSVALEDPADDDEEAHLCDLHFIANCQSCSKWDEKLADGGLATEIDEEDDRGWMSHALSFTKDKLGKDLTWRKKAEEELVVIDPREKARELKLERKKNDGMRGERIR